MPTTDTIPLSSLTTETVDGTGVFDGLMRAARAHLNGEFEGGRITGQEFTTAYIASLESVLSASVAFLLGRDQAYWAGLTSERTLNTLLPEQVEQIRAQTLDVRLDGQPVKGLLGKQKELYSQQITSYIRNSELNAAKIFSDAWITQKTLDDGLLPPSSFENASVNTVMETLKRNNQLG